MLPGYNDNLHIAFYTRSFLCSHEPIIYLLGFPAVFCAVHMVETGNNESVVSGTANRALARAGIFLCEV